LPQGSPARKGPAFDAPLRLQHDIENAPLIAATRI
jgi:hypothetical protein